MMVHDFGFYDMNTFELPRRFEFPGVSSSPLESSPVLEIFWRRRASTEASSASSPSTFLSGIEIVNNARRHLENRCGRVREDVQSAHMGSHVVRSFSIGLKPPVDTSG